MFKAINTVLGAANLLTNLVTLDKVDHLSNPTVRVSSNSNTKPEDERDIITDWIYKRLVSKEELDTRDVRKIITERGLSNVNEILWVYNPYCWTDIEVVHISIDGWGAKGV